MVNVFPAPDPNRQGVADVHAKRRTRNYKYNPRRCISIKAGTAVESLQLTSNSPSLRWFPRCCCMKAWAEKLPVGVPPSCPSCFCCPAAPNANLGGRAGRAGGGPAPPPPPVVGTVGEPNVKANGGGPSSAEQVLCPGTAAAGASACLPSSGVPDSAAAPVAPASVAVAAPDRFLTALFDAELRRPLPARGAREARSPAPSGVK